MLSCGQNTTCTCISWAIISCFVSPSWAAFLFFLLNIQWHHIFFFGGGGQRSSDPETISALCFTSLLNSENDIFPHPAIRKYLPLLLPLFLPLLHLISLINFNYPLIFLISSFSFLFSPLFLISLFNFSSTLHKSISFPSPKGEEHIFAIFTPP